MLSPNPNTRAYKPKVQAYPHQLEALQRMDGRKVFALLMAMRTGKTKVALDDFGQLELAGKVKDLLVIAPAGVYRTWQTAIEEHVSKELEHRLLVLIWNSSSNGSKEKAWRELFLTHRGDSPRVVLMNIEALSTMDRARDFCFKFLRDPEHSMIVIDESTIIKNPSAKRTKFVNRQLAGKAAYRRILSGLPTPRSPLDIYSQFEFLDTRILGFSSYYTFRARYAIMQNARFGGRKVPIVVGYRNTEELQTKIAPHSFRVPFRPNIPSTYTIREVELTKEQQRIYDEIKRFATARLSETAHVTATAVITQIIRMHQVLCGYTRDEQDQLHEVPENKTAELLRLFEDYAGKAVIWCSYDHSVRKVSAALLKEYPENPVAHFWGGNVSSRETEEQIFKTDPRCRFMVATPSAGGRGRTWSVADLVVYYSSTNDLEHRDQSEQRVQGINKERQVDYIDLITPGTVEEKILKALRKKISMASAINGDNWREWVV